MRWLAGALVAVTVGAHASTIGQPMSLNQINGFTANTGPGQASSGTLRVMLSSDTTVAPTPGAVWPIVFNSSVTVTIRPVVLGTVGKATASVSGTSISIFQPNPLRLAIECWALCSNTNDIFTSYAVTASSMTDPPLEKCSYWASPPASISTAAFSVISADGGTQAIRCREY